VTYTVDFAPTTVRRFKLWMQISAILCVGLVSIIAVVPLLQADDADIHAYSGPPNTEQPPLSSARRHDHWHYRHKANRFKLGRLVHLHRRPYDPSNRSGFERVAGRR
jgi:hypothetical protein